MVEERKKGRKKKTIYRNNKHQWSSNMSRAHVIELEHDLRQPHYFSKFPYKLEYA
jgi:hypothetical protein